MSDKIELGMKVRDRISGVEGIVVGLTEWLYGCRTVSVKPSKPKEDGTLHDNLAFDEPQVEVVGPGLTEQAREANAKSPYTGGPDRPVHRDRTP